MNNLCHLRDYFVVPPLWLKLEALLPLGQQLALSSAPRARSARPLTMGKNLFAAMV